MVSKGQIQDMVKRQNQWGYRGGRIRDFKGTSLNAYLEENGGILIDSQVSDCEDQFKIMRAFPKIGNIAGLGKK